jgi:hypothetical protein
MGGVVVDPIIIFALLALLGHLIDAARPEEHRMAAPDPRQSPPRVTHRPLSGAERVAAHRRRHGDAYRRRHRAYMQLWRARKAAERRAAAG